jgi:hypothetical protein
MVTPLTDMSLVPALALLSLSFLLMPAQILLIRVLVSLLGLLLSWVTASKTTVDGITLDLIFLVLQSLLTVEIQYGIDVKLDLLLVSICMKFPSQYPSHEINLSSTCS